MTTKLITLFIFLGGFFLLGTKLTLAVSNYDVVFSELMWMGSHASSSDEWIELKNTTDYNIDLTGWQITYLKEDQETLMLEIPEGIVPAGGYFLISNNVKDYKFANGQSILNIDPDLVDSSVTLSNSNLELKLYDGQWNDGRQLIDIAGDGNAPLKGDNTNKISMERTFPLSDGSSPASWQEAILQENLDSGSLEIANPHNSGKPIINNSRVNPLSVYLKKTEVRDLRFETEVADNLDIKSVTINLSSIGGLTNQKLYDDGTNSDKISGDGIYSLTYQFTLSDIFNQVGLKELKVKAENSNSLISNSTLNLGIYQLSTDLTINEIFPRPESNSQDEYIELYNRGDVPVNLYDWQLDDVAIGGSKLYKITENLIINPKSYYTYNKSVTKISLNDDGDSVRLINPIGVEQAVVTYAVKPEKDYSYNFNDSGWYWINSSTPNQKNSLEVLVKSEIASNAKISFTQSKTNSSIKLISNTQIKGGDKLQEKQNITFRPAQLVESNPLVNLIHNDSAKPADVKKNVYWIKSIQYVILFTVVICMIMLGQFLWPKKL